MKNCSFKTGVLFLALATAVACAGTQSGVAIDGNEYAKTIPVTEANFNEAEAAVNFVKWVQKDAMNKLVHLTDLYPAGEAPTIRANRDTLYSVGLFDNSKGLVIQQPENGIFQSVLVIDESGYALDYVWQPGEIKIGKTDGFVLLIFRIGLEEGIEKAREAQKTIAVDNYGDGIYQPEPYNKADRDVLWSRLSEECISSGTFLLYANKEGAIDERTRLLSNAAGWGGMGFSVNNYQISPNFKDGACYETTFEDPKVDEFWSFTLYDAEGWLLPVGDNVLNSRDAVPNEDGTYTVRFNCEGMENNLDPQGLKEYGFTWRSYGSSYKVKAGEWNPIKNVKKVR